MNRQRRRSVAAALAVATIGVALRLTGIGWGLPAHVSPFEPPVHPDEHVATAAAAMLYRGPSQLQFLWGGALYPRTAWLAEAAVQLVDPRPPVHLVGPGVRRWEGGASQLLVLRSLNVGLALLTAGCVLWVGAALGGAPLGVLAAALFLFFPGPVLDSHYARPDVLVGCGVAAALACAVRAAAGGGRRWLGIGGVCAGLATAAMLSGVIGFGALAGALLERVRRGALGARGVREAALGAAVTALGAAAGWLAGNLEALIYWPAFWAGLGVAASSHQGGNYAFPLHLITTVSFYALGSVATLAAWAGIVLLARRRPPGYGAVLGLLCFGTLLLGRVGGDMMRHLEPLAPAFAVAAALALGALARVGSRIGLGERASRAVVFAAVLALTLQLSVAYVWPMQFREDPRYRAGRWLVDHLPAGTRVGRSVSFDGDVSYSPRLPAPNDLRVAPLRLFALRPDTPVSTDRFDVIATSDYAESHARRPAARRFFAALREGREFAPLESFDAGRDPLCLPDLWGATRPSDLLYVRTGMHLFARRS